MQKKVLSEIDYYWGEIKMPPKFEIDLKSLKNSFIKEYVKESKVSEDFYNYKYNDYVANHS